MKCLQIYKKTSYFVECSKLLFRIRKTGVLYKEEWLEDHILVEGRLGGVIESSQRTLRLVEEAKL